MKELPERKPVPNTEQGLYRKFRVERVDGKHPDCEYFVLDIDHDPHAKVALHSYVLSVESTHPQLAADMRARYNLGDN